VTTFTDPPEWSGPSSDPNDEQFGDVVEPTSIDRAAGYEAVLVGEPYDGAVIGRRGAREGPAALRDALAGLTTHHLAHGPVASVGDLGDVDIRSDASPEDAQATVESTAADIYDAGAFPVFLGGDNSLTAANAAPLLEDSAGAISFDAHLDCRELHDGPTSGTPYRQLHRRGLDGFAVVGARHFETSTPYHEYVHERGGRVVTADRVRVGPRAAIDRAIDALGDVDVVYVSLDMDVLDAAAAPGVSAPTPGGITARELFAMLARVASDGRVAGFEIVECAPPLDEGRRTVAAGARAVAHFLSGLARGGAYRV